MSSINVKYHLESHDWHIEYWDRDPINYVIRIGMTDGSPVGTNVYFSGLSYGYSLFDTSNGTDKLVIEKRFPMEGHTLICSDQEYMAIDGVVLKRNTTYTLALWASNKGDTFSTEFMFITPDGMVNYPSFQYNEESKVFEAPVPYPQDGKIYIWNEDTVNWVEFVEDTNLSAEPSPSSQAVEASFETTNPDDKYIAVSDPLETRTLGRGGTTPNWGNVESTPEKYAERLEQGY